MRAVAAGITDVGLQRDHNEDSFAILKEHALYIVADGMGGHRAGDVASRLATEAIVDFFRATAAEDFTWPFHFDSRLSEEENRLLTGIKIANRQIIERSARSRECHGMGTTIVGALFNEKAGKMYIGHVGDSRCYRLREGRLELLTQDHTLLNDVLELKPDIDADSAARLPRNVITNALGMDKNVRVSVRTYEIAAGDRYVLCSDGLTDEVDDGQIAQALAVGGTVDDQVQLLIDLAAEGGGARDNIAVVVLSCSVSPGIGKLPQRPVPPRRAYPEDVDAQVLLEMEIDGEDESVEVTVVTDPDDDDAPELEIMEAKPASNVGKKRRRPDETVVLGKDRE